MLPFRRSEIRERWPSCSKRGCRNRGNTRRCAAHQLAVSTRNVRRKSLRNFAGGVPRERERHRVNRLALRIFRIVDTFSFLGATRASEKRDTFCASSQSSLDNKEIKGRRKRHRMETCIGMVTSVGVAAAR